MNCDKFKDELINNNADNLTPEAINHSKECPHCQAKLNQLQSDMQTIGKMLTFDNGSIDVNDRVMLSIRTRKHKHTHKINRVALISILVATAACISLLVIFNMPSATTTTPTNSNIIAMNTKNDNAIIEEMLNEIYLPADDDSCIEYYEIYE